MKAAQQRAAKQARDMHVQEAEDKKANINKV
jgi:hypothetical protein